MKGTKEIIRKIAPKVIFWVVVIAAWQVLYSVKNSDTYTMNTFPSIQEIGKSLYNGFSAGLAKDEMFSSLINSLILIGKGLFFGVIGAFIFSALSICFKWVYSIYTMLVSIFDLLPGVALLPLAILWFGVGEPTIIFLMIHSVVWPMSRSIIDGFQSTPGIYVETGKNIGLRGTRLITGVYLPASSPYIISGLKVGWARAWRALISAEMIFGATSTRGGGIGFYIFNMRTKMDYAGLYASLIVILIIGLIIEYGVFANVEKHTIRKWGMIR